MGDASVGGIPLLVVIFGLVEFAKRLRVTGDALTMLSAGLGILFGVLYQLAQLYPALVPWLGILIYGLAMGLAASGIYDFAKQFKPTIQK